MTKVGRRSKNKWKVGDLCRSQFDNEWYSGEIIAADDPETQTARVLFEDGECLEMPFSDLRRISGKNKSTSDRGFSIYDVVWDKKHNTTFTVKSNDVLFYGSWFKGKSKDKTAYRVDIRVKVSDSDLHVEDLFYGENDPRKNIQSLNADICCAISKWFHYSCKENPMYTINDLKKKSLKPSVRINELQTLDDLITSLKEMRQIAVKCGGIRYVTFEGDSGKSDEPRVTIQIDLSRVAKMYMDTGKIPKCVNPGVIDRAVETGGKKGANRVSSTKKVTTDLKSLKDLHKQIKNCTDQSVMRKYRKSMRLLGIKGGIRGLEKLIEEKSNEISG